MGVQSKQSQSLLLRSQSSFLDMSTFLWTGMSSKDVDGGSNYRNHNDLLSLELELLVCYLWLQIEF